LPQHPYTGCDDVVEEQSVLPKRLEVNDPLPELTLLDQYAGPQNLRRLVEGKPCVLFFFPKAGTAFCTKQACQFRDQYEDFSALGAVVIGISSDTPEELAQFAKAHRLPFPLLSDSENLARKAFGVPKTLGLMPGRVTYVCGPRSTVKLVFNSQFQPEKHIEHALDLLQQWQTRATKDA
jgi:thioredoxin-dependent peroxiredoxin